MKKQYIIIAFFLLLGIKQADAQFAFGGKTGLTFSTVRYKVDKTNQLMRPFMKIKLGNQLGLTGEYYFVRGLAIQTDLQYIGKGFKYAFQYSDGKQRFDFAQINIAGKISFYEEGNITISAYAAPFTSFWVYGMKTETDNKMGEIKKENFLFNDSTYAYNRWDAGVSVGLELKITQTWHRKFLFDMHYEYSLISNDIDKVDGMLNRVIFIGVGYLFNQ